MSGKTLILGLGNPILSDDGIGIVVARRLQGKIPNVDVATSACVGLDLLDLIESYQRLFVIDALATTDSHPGTLHKLPLDAGTLHLFSSHGINFFEILELGHQLGRAMPGVIGLYGIEIGEEVPFGETLTAEVAATLEKNVAEIARDILTSLPTKSCNASNTNK